MNNNRFLKWTRTAFAALGIVTVALGVAQNYSNLSGGNSRDGRNAGVLSTPGRGLLTWYAPLLTDQLGRTLIRDNNSTETARVGGWIDPPFADESGGAYVAFPAVPTTDPVNVGENLLRGLGTGLPGHAYSFTIPAGPGANNPLGKNFVADSLNTFEWTVEPPNVVPNQRFPRNYALSVWLPSGPVRDGGGTLRYPQRYFVYEITHAGGTTVDVVDTYAGGFGWVRLGGGGLPTTRLFPYDGTNPIRIKLYNTVPRLAGHENDNVGSVTYPWLNTYNDVPYTSVVYADAVKAEPVTGAYVASPIVAKSNAANLGSQNYAFAARNNYTVGTYNGQSVTVSKGEVTAYNYTTGLKLWSFAPLDESTYATTMDNTSVGVTATLPWAAPGTLEPPYNGTDYYSAPMVTTPGTEVSVTYAPTLVDGSYEILAWCPGTRGTETLAQEVTYRITQGSQPPIDVTIDQDAARGWVRLGAVRYAHQGSIGEDLTVEVTNLSSLGTDVGKFAYADAIRFIGAANLSITSTPVHADAQVIATNGGPVAQQGVILTAAEDGRIYCLDAVGNGDGTTDILWAYPSVPDPDNPGWTDPNQVAGEDGVGGVAQMPVGFDLSTALVQNIGGTDYLFVGTKNGRVYCLEMAGRGDMDLARRVPGTTRRVWTYPNDYPAPARNSNLGPIMGSLSFATTTNGPTIFVPASTGRMLALSALPTSVPNKTTSVYWAYPALNQPTIGEIEMSPMIANGNVYFGTRTADNDDRGRFYCLNMDTGAVVWQFNGTTQWDDIAPIGVDFIPADDFVAGPAFATAAQIGAGQVDTVYVANENRWVSALDAATGAVLWTTNELNTQVASHLTMSSMDVFTGGGLGAVANATVVLCPTVDGRYPALFAMSGVGFGATNRFNTKRAWQYSVPGQPILSGMANGHSHLYGTDSDGFIYAFNAVGNGLGGDIDGPGVRDFVENDDSDPDVEAFRNAKIVFVTKDTYDRLKEATGAPNHLTFAQATNAARIVTRNAFDWGETIYALVYDFPYQDTYLKGAWTGMAAPAPTVSYSISVEGASVRTAAVQSQEFSGTTSPSGNEGYAVFPLVLQNGGSFALAPGGGKMTFSVSTTTLTAPPRTVSVTPNPANATRTFAIANPLGLIMVNGDLNRQIGNTQDPSDPGNAVNGSPDIAATAGNNESRLTVPVGRLSHGQAGSYTFAVVDRSLMSELRGPGRGLDQVRVERRDLGWIGGKAAVLNPLDAIYGAYWLSGKGLEDYPELFPNISLDYPDIARERQRFTKDPTGQSENPVFGPVTLNGTTNVNLAAPGFPSRTLNPTPMEVSIDVPRFQPPNRSQLLDSAGAAVFGAYAGRMRVYVDSNSDGIMSLGRGRRETYRSATVAMGLAEDERISVNTETVDFGSLPMGGGYDPVSPTGGGSFSPWGGAFSNMFRPISITNEGNVNAINVRLAKFYNDGALNPWRVFSPDNNDLAWLSGPLNVHATFDSQFALLPTPIIPKARPGDLVATQFRDNPRVRDNANIGATAQPMLTGSPDPERPQVAVTLPFGFPSGLYDYFLRVIVDRTPDEADPIDLSGNSLEPSDDFNVRFKAREARLTNTRTTNTAPMIDDLVATGTENFLHDNTSPTGMRTQGGHVLAAFTSNRFSAPVGAGFNKTLPVAKLDQPQYRIYISSVRGTTPNGSGHPTNDLNNFVPQAGQWFNNAVAEFPTQPFLTTVPGDPIVAGTDNYGGASLSTMGDTDPFVGSLLARPYMAFVGQAQRQGPNERYLDSRIMLTELRVTGTGGVSAGNPVAITPDPTMRKGRPSLIQGRSGSVVFYTAFGTGMSAIHYVTYDGATASAVGIFPAGTGFESVGSPTATARTYSGASYTGGMNNGEPMIEVLFSGKLRGRPATEVFLGRLLSNGRLTPQNRAIHMPARTQERLTADAEPGTFRSQGVVWNRNSAVNLFQSLSNGPVTNLEVPGTRRTDATTGMITFDLTIGGRAFLNPSLGTIRLSTPISMRDAVLYLDYQPRFIRISNTNEAHSRPQMVWDNRFTGEFDYWANNLGNPIAPADPVRSGRYIVSYNRAATNGQAARPYYQTLRLGAQLPTPINTQANGFITGFTVAGLTSYYQLDPANGRIYTTAADEGRTVTVTYTGTDVTSGAPIAIGPIQVTIGLVGERSEGQVPIDQAVNEADSTLFLDPFETNGAGRRPGLFWMLWTSTRGGAPDLFLQTLAPRLAPAARR